MKFPKKTWNPVWIIIGLMVVLVIAMQFLFSYERSILGVPPDDAPYRQTEQTTEARVSDLLARMTLEEKIGQMALVEKNSVHDIDDIATYGIGAMLSGAGAKPAMNTVTGWRDMVAEFVAVSRTSRLGIPVLYGADAIHGHSNVPGATIFPHAIGLGASGDELLVEHIARVTAKELAATGIYWTYSPNLDLPQDIRWGRTYETFSDDPVLAAKLGAAFVRGTEQPFSNATGSAFVISTPKHFIGAGGMVWGSSSNNDFYIDQGTTPPDETLLRDVYLPPFKAAVDAGAGSLMVGLNSWGEEKLSANHYLITDVLKGELGFTGFVVSDWYGVYEIPGGNYEAAITAINAGIDVVMLPFEYKEFITNVSRAVKLGRIDEARIDDAVRRILTAKFELGLFDMPPNTELPTVGSNEDRVLAREAVAKSLVLLKDDANVLPIQTDVTHIRVAGSAADNVGLQSGAWTIEWQGIDGNWLPGSTSILKGIQDRALEGVRVEYNILGTFEAGEKADLGIAIVGEKPYAEGWGDSALPTLSKEDTQAIAKLKASSKKLLVIIVSGRPLIITDDIASWDAVVAAWLPGTEGGGVADVLYGDVPFTGKLPLPWPRSVSQLPVLPNGNTADGTTLLFPRYAGLK